MARLSNITIENARIFFKDFSASGPFAGGTKRTFCVEIPEEMGGRPAARRMERQVP